jgi:hypothetical protein
MKVPATANLLGCLRAGSDRCLAEAWRLTIRCCLVVWRGCLLLESHQTSQDSFSRFHAPQKINRYLSAVKTFRAIVRGRLEKQTAVLQFDAAWIKTCSSLL